MRPRGRQSVPGDQGAQGPGEAGRREQAAAGTDDCCHLARGTDGHEAFTAFPTTELQSVLVFKKLKKEKWDRKTKQPNRGQQMSQAGQLVAENPG